MPESDVALVRSARAGGREAWAALVDRHGPMLLRVLRVRAKDRAEDLFQEVWAMLMEDGGRRLAGWDPRRPLPPWLVTVALNHARKRLAGRKRMPAPGPPRPERPDTEGVAEAFAGLPPRDRLILDLVVVEGLPHADVAAALGVSPSSVSTLAERARQRLQAAYLKKNP